VRGEINKERVNALKAQRARRADEPRQGDAHGQRPDGPEGSAVAAGGRSEGRAQRGRRGRGLADETLERMGRRHELSPGLTGGKERKRRSDRCQTERKRRTACGPTGGIHRAGRRVQRGLAHVAKQVGAGPADARGSGGRSRDRRGLGASESGQSANRTGSTGNRTTRRARTARERSERSGARCASRRTTRPCATGREAERRGGERAQK